VVEQIRVEWNTLIPRMEDIAAVAQEKVEPVKTGKKQAMALACDVGGI